MYALASKILASASQTNRVGKFHRLPSGGGSTCITDALRYLSRDAQYVPRASETFASVLTPRWVLLASVSGRIPIIERGHEMYKGEKDKFQQLAGRQLQLQTAIVVSGAEEKKKRSPDGG